MALPTRLLTDIETDFHNFNRTSKLNLLFYRTEPKNIMYWPKRISEEISNRDIFLLFFNHYLLECKKIASPEQGLEPWTFRLKANQLSYPGLLTKREKLKFECKFDIILRFGLEFYLGLHIRFTYVLNWTLIQTFDKSCIVLDLIRHLIRLICSCFLSKFQYVHSQGLLEF